MEIENDLSKHPSGGPAFPVPMGTQHNQYACGVGMTLRDWFAGQALAGLSVSDRFIRDADSNTAQAQWAYDLADAMLAARSRK